MSGEQHVVRGDDVVADANVVREVRAAHEEAVVADDRRRVLGAPAMQVGALADGVAIADLEARGRPAVRQVLGLVAENDVHVDVVLAPDPGATADLGEGSDAGTRADLDVRLDDREGADLDVGRDPRCGIDDGTGIDHRGARPFARTTVRAWPARATASPASGSASPGDSGTDSPGIA